MMTVTPRPCRRTGEMKAVEIIAIFTIFFVVGCGIRPLTEEEISITDDRCPYELFLAGQCDQPPLVPESVTE